MPGSASSEDAVAATRVLTMNVAARIPAVAAAVSRRALNMWPPDQGYERSLSSIVCGFAPPIQGVDGPGQRLAAGSRIVNSLPRPGPSLQAEIVPLWRST